MRPLILTVCGAILLISAGCATYRTDITGTDESAAVGSVRDSTKVNVMFLFYHYRQTSGFDAIPKLERQYQIISGFDDFFQDAMKEISGVGNYNAYTVFSSDVHDPKRRALKDSLIGSSDFTVSVECLNLDVFSHRILGVLASVGSLTLLPVPYIHNYSMVVTVADHEGRQVARYVREASTRTWVQTALIFAYPFHPEKRKVEEIYVAMLHDIFRNIEKNGDLGGDW